MGGIISDLRKIHILGEKVLWLGTGQVPRQVARGASGAGGTVLVGRHSWGPQCVGVLSSDFFFFSVRWKVRS